MNRAADAFSDGTRSLVAVLRPKGSGWREVQHDSRFSSGPYPARAFIHKSGLAVISAVEVMADESKGPEYHISVSRQIPGFSTQRCDTNAAHWVLDQFGLDGAEEDNHVPNGLVRNFWRPVATGLIGLECECKAEEPAIAEDKGDFIWRGITK